VLAVFARGARADAALHALAQELDARDRALAMRLSYGAVQRAGTLDHVIAELAGRPATRLDAPVRAALLVGLYELLYLSGAPDYAVVADAVELAKVPGRPGHLLVNAVMRRATSEGRALLDGLADATPQQAALAHSHPQWIARLWFDELGGEQARALMRAGNEPGEVALRANTLVTDADELAVALPVATHRDADISDALVLEGPFDAHASAQWRDGAFAAQSRAAMLVAHALDPQPGESVLDLCAAPGGNTTHIAALMGDEGRVVAVERSRRRARALADTATRMRATSVEVVVADAAQARGEQFDRVLVDPPCSGLGTLQARPDQRWHQTPQTMAELAQAQASILAAGASALRPGGVLVYSTCTISATENEGLIAAFLDSHADFSLDNLANRLPGYALARAHTDRAPAAGRAREVAARSLLTLPHRDHTAGFFIARLRRT
jgi:16S rRNA (cytosine967-C5)-methyltransferase